LEVGVRQRGHVDGVTEHVRCIELVLEAQETRVLLVIELLLQLVLLHLKLALQRIASLPYYLILLNSRSGLLGKLLLELHLLLLDEELLHLQVHGAGNLVLEEALGREEELGLAEAA
jgi:hypothetical protein